ncbi:MAG: 3-oxoacyl-ACP reductase FabG [candidate division Zixibacteria bacterium]|nr:3-oxoacyl-ACP reductase FabG [candidate division Zixibacteria bacterium]MDH3936635.1 3-oxoacyl-ACP reductase FabG [candidate division Zixibacteria bacterium]MDH4034180.1 3-oxoacyl-ACP reductase FabG [candidate division Zixibacteria bacterium]
MFDLTGKAAIVTGSSMGIGSAAALYLAQCGADVAVNYRKHDAEANALADEIKNLGRKSLAIKCDVTNHDDVAKMVETVVAEFGKLDILVNNAGVNWDGVIWKMTEEMWDTVLDTDLKGYFSFIRAVAPHFRSQKSGKIVNVTSINGLRGKFGQANYSAAKAGIIGLTKAVAKELGRASINVNAVAPGMILTDMMAQLTDEVKQTAIDETVLARLGTPEECASVIAFLCSEESRHITGEVIKIDGGQYI